MSFLAALKLYLLISLAVVLVLVVTGLAKEDRRIGRQFEKRLGHSLPGAGAPVAPCTANDRSPNHSINEVSR